MASSSEDTEAILTKLSVLTNHDPIVLPQESLCHKVTLFVLRIFINLNMDHICSKMLNNSKDTECH